MAQDTNSGGTYGKRPLWQWIVFYLVIAAIVYGLIYYFVTSGSSSYTSNSANVSQSAATTQNVVTYSDSGFSPNTLTVNQGDTVTFTNSASDSVRVASNPHPLHNGYPTTGGCVSSTFDSCSNIAPGASWSFKFDIAGTWGYHNHLNPTEGGTIIVQ